MTVALTTPLLTREEFFDWAQRQDRRYEFDGVRPVAMAGGSRRHSLIVLAIATSLRSRLRGTGYQTLADAGVATLGDAVRYPDVLITGNAGSGADLLIAGVLVVFEVLSPSTERFDRLVKPGEFAAVPSIQRYVIVE